MTIQLSLFRWTGFRQGIAPVALFLFLFSCSAPPPDLNQIDLEDLDGQVMILVANAENLHFEDAMNTGDDSKVMPRTIGKEGELELVRPGDWTSGFFPGILWFMYELTGYGSWEEKAVEYTQLLKDEMYDASSHDVGFRMYCSYGNGLRLTGDSSYIPILVESARTLISRYNETVGCIRSWDFNADVWEYPVIIDNLMNLELLFWASEQTGDSIYREVAIHHANTTLKNHFRPDFSTFHVVDYDPRTGEVRGKYTHQGFSPESTWSRGEAWALYGYTMAYRFTRDARYLEQAEGIAKFILNHPRLPKDRIPYWDFDAPKLRNEPRDASAAAIMASAMYELSTYSPEGWYYKERADWIMESLSSSAYRSPEGENYGFLLDHSTGSLPGNTEVDVPLIYADYYYLEALLRRKALS